MRLILVPNEDGRTYGAVALHGDQDTRGAIFITYDEA